MANNASHLNNSVVWKCANVYIQSSHHDGRKYEWSVVENKKNSLAENK